MKISFLLILLLILPAALPAAATGDGRSLLPDDAFDHAQLMGVSSMGARLERIAIDHPGFSQAWRVTVPARAPTDRAVQLGVPIPDAVSVGEVLLVEFWARMISSQDETGEARGLLVLEQSIAPYGKAIMGYPWSVGREWKKIVFPARGAKALAAGQAVIHLRLGGAAQVVEIGGLQVLAFGQDYDMSRLPSSSLRVTYVGHEADASWREAAATRIEKYRKGDLAVRVVDTAGHSVANASVRARLIRPAFRFSSAIDAHTLLAPEATRRGAVRYRQMIPQLFNLVTMESDLKWPSWEKNSARTLSALDWLHAHGLPVRGHVLLWPSWRHTPEDLAALASDPAALRARILAHVRDILTATGDRVGDWDVINEPQTNNDILKILGDDIMVDVFQLAHRLHPHGRLFLNEAVNFSQPDKLAIFEHMALDLRRRGAPIDGLGFQCHYGSTLTPPSEIIKVLDRFAADGFVLNVTEFDINLPDSPSSIQTVKADYLRDFFTAVFSNPAVDTLQMWGFWEGQHWRPDAALWRKDWTIKPSGQAYLDLVKRDWTTDVTLATDTAGRAATRGFLGDYEITVKNGTHTTTLPITLTASSPAIMVTLP